MDRAGRAPVRRLEGEPVIHDNAEWGPSLPRTVAGIGVFGRRMALRMHIDGINAEFAPVACLSAAQRENRRRRYCAMRRGCRTATVRGSDCGAVSPDDQRASARHTIGPTAQARIGLRLHRRVLVSTVSACMPGRGAKPLPAAMARHHASHVRSIAACPRQDAATTKRDGADNPPAQLSPRLEPDRSRMRSAHRRHRPSTTLSRNRP